MGPALSMRSFKRLISVLVLLALVVGGIGYLGRAVELPTGRGKNGGFLKGDREYDVLLFGTSHVVNGFLPMQLWKDFGIRSYNLGIHGGSLAASYWQLRLAVEYQKPKVAVLDVLNAEETENVMSVGLCHPALDAYPLSKTKIQAVMDLYQDTKDRTELLFPLDIYHNRWKELTGESLRQPVQYSMEKGAEAMLGSTPVASPEGSLERAEGKTWAMGYLEAFVRYCQEYDIIPLITFIPYCYEGSMERQSYGSAALELAKSLGAETLDLRSLETLDPAGSWSDAGGHLNATGARKTTQALGQWLRENTDLPDGSQDTLWAGDYAFYRDKWLYRVENYTEPEKILNIASLLGAQVRAEIPEGEAPLSGLRLKAMDAQVQTGLEEGLVLGLTVTDDRGQVLVTRRYRQTESLELVQ